MLYHPVVLPSLLPTSVGLVDLLHLILEALHHLLAHLLVTRDPSQTALRQQADPLPPLSRLGRLLSAECTLTGCE